MEKASCSVLGLPSTAPSNATTVSAARIRPCPDTCRATARALRRLSSSTSRAGEGLPSTPSSTSGETALKFSPICSSSALRRGDWEAKISSTGCSSFHMGRPAE